MWKWIPNLISAYRLCVLPFIIYTIIQGNNHLFFILIGINFFSDWLDGIIARRFNLQTQLGADLDSAGDLGTYLVCAIGFYFLESNFVSEHQLSLILAIIIYSLPYIFSYFKFKKLPSFHLYSSKVTAYLSALFVIAYSIWGYQFIIYYTFITAVYFSELEVLLCVILLRNHRSNLKSIIFYKQINE